MESPLRFLADEGCDFAVVRALRANGCDVTAISEIMTRSIDQQLIEQAYREQRVLLTEDKDWGVACLCQPCRIFRRDFDSIPGECTNTSGTNHCSTDRKISSGN